VITQLVLEKIPLRWVLRTDRNDPDLVPAVRQAVLAVDPTQPPADFATMAGLLARSISPHRFNMLMLVLFSGLSLVLAAIGVYGLTAYAVVQRTREIGIRVSLGASPTQLLRGLLRQGLRLGLGGTVLGPFGAASLGRVLRSLPVRRPVRGRADDHRAFVTMTTAVVAATHLPAARASRIDPMLALRQDVA
jgi:putative ABC transport system permease protein